MRDIEFNFFWYDLYSCNLFSRGFGTLSRKISDKCPNIKIDIFEPSLNFTSKNLCKEYPNINFINKISRKYDISCTIDVLEHCINPIKKLYEITKAVKVNGYLIFANHFRPSIKCHLLETFHLKYTFFIFTKCFGLKFVEKCKYQHISIFKKTKNSYLTPKNLIIKILEIVSKAFFSFLEILSFLKRKFL